MVMMIIRTMKKNKKTKRCRLYKSFVTRNFLYMVGSFAFLSVIRTKK